MYKNIDPKAFKEGFESSENAVLIDVRTPAEIEEISIDGHVAINISSPSFVEEIEKLNKDKTYYIYCRSGNRSGKACQYMSSIGFKELYNLEGGIIAWAQKMNV